MVIQCLNCNRLQETLKHKDRRFCCEDCWYEYMTKLPGKKDGKTKVCDTCHKRKKTSEFYSKKHKRKNGDITILAANMCKKCFKLKMKNSYATRSPQFEITCKQCGAKKMKKKPLEFCSVACVRLWRRNNHTIKPTKKCPRCLEVKDRETEFRHAWRPREDGTKLRIETGYCIDCDRKFCYEHYDKQKEWRDKNKERLKVVYRMRKYGLKADDYYRLLEEFGDTCNICGLQLVYDNSCIDHCHASNQIRGMLCEPCNTGIGKLGDSPLLLGMAIRYLEKFKTLFDPTNNYSDDVKMFQKHRNNKNRNRMLPEYVKRLEEQGNKCAICMISKDEWGKNLAWDHDHKSGMLRGLLCDHCNHALGCFKESIEKLEKAIKYLEERKKIKENTAA